MVLILAGNTCYPIILRGLLCLVRRWGTGTGWHESIDFLLKSPRRCYTHLFPGYATLWLSIVTAALVVVQVAAIFITDHRPKLFGRPIKFSEVAFFAVSTRTAGFAIRPLDGIFPSTAFVMCICMWISTSPVVVAMRSTRQVCPDRALLGVDNYDLSGMHREEAGLSEARVRPVRKQLVAFMSQHSVVLLILFFSILVLERAQFDGRATTRGGVESEENFLWVVFEFCSAWGTVGLTMAATPWSFSGDWSRGAQLCLMAIMFLGRLRGLPDSIDPSVSFFSTARSGGEAPWVVEPGGLVLQENRRLMATTPPQAERGGLEPAMGNGRSLASPRGGSRTLGILPAEPEAGEGRHAGTGAAASLARAGTWGSPADADELELRPRGRFGTT